MAILTRDGLMVRKVTRLSSGRGIALDINRVRIINVYAPSGATKKRERETFFNNDLPLLLPTTTGEIILAGDFNCILNANDSTGYAQ
jgi:exonuclease III